MGASLAALTWARPGPAARWLTGEALAEVSVRLAGATTRARRRSRPASGRFPRALRPRAARRGPPDPGAGRRGPLPAAARPVPRQPGRTRLPCPSRGAAGAARGAGRDPPYGPGGRRCGRPSARLGCAVPRLLHGRGPYGAAGRRGRSLIALFDTPLLAQAGLVEARVVRKALRARGRRRGPAPGRPRGSGLPGAVAPPAAGPPRHLLDGDARAAAGRPGGDPASAGGVGGGGAEGVAGVDSPPPPLPPRSGFARRGPSLSGTSRRSSRPAEPQDRFQRGKRDQPRRSARRSSRIRHPAVRRGEPLGRSPVTHGQASTSSAFTHPSPSGV